MILFAKSAGGNWSAAGTWSTTGSGGADNSGPPVASTDVIFEAGSGTVTIDADAACRSLDTTSGTGTFTGTILHNSFTLTIGDATAGANNVALKLNSGMTAYTLTSATTSAISFVSTSTTKQTVDYGGKTAGNITFNGVAGNWAMTTAITTGTTATVTISNGTLQTDGTSDTSALAHSWGLFNSNATTTRVVTLGNSTITLKGVGNSFDFRNTTLLTLNAGTSSLIVTGASAGFIVANTGGTGKTFYSATFSGGSHGSPNNVSLGGSTFTNFTVNGVSSTTDFFQPGSTIVVTGALTIAGNSSINRLLVRSTTLGTARTFTTTGATVTISNTDFRDITLSVTKDVSAQTDIGDCGGNSGITFPAAVTQTWSGTSGGNWSTNAWTTRVPLPQDDVVINNAFSGGQTVTVDMPRIGRTVDFYGTSAVTWGIGTVAFTVYGSLRLTTAVTMGGSNKSITFEGRGPFTCTTAGRTWFGSGDATVGIAMVNGSLTLLDNLGLSGGAGGGRTVSITSGTLNANGFNVSADLISMAGGTMQMGTGTWSGIRSSGTTWSVTGGTVIPGGTIAITNTSSSSKTFAGGGKTYNNLTITGVGTGAIIIQGSNTFNTVTINAPKTVNFTSGTTQIVGSLVANGTSVNPITLQAVTGGSAFNLSRSSGQNVVNWCSIKDSNATGGAVWAALNSTSVSNNNGWYFPTFTATSNIIGDEDCIRFYGKALTSDEVLALYNSGLGIEATSTDLTFKSLERTIAEYSTLTDTLIKSVGHLISENITSTDIVNKSLERILSESVTLSDVIETLKSLLLTITESLSLTDLLTKNSEKLNSEQLVLTDSNTKSINANIVNTLNVIDSLITNTSIIRTFNESLNLTDARLSSINKLLNEIISNTDTFTYDLVAPGGITQELIEVLTFSDLLTKGTVDRVTSTLSLLDIISFTITRDPKRRVPNVFLSTRESRPIVNRVKNRIGQYFDVSERITSTLSTKEQVRQQPRLGESVKQKLHLAKVGNNV